MRVQSVNARNGIMRICMYTDTALPKLGGQELVVDALARQFQALGHQPVVFAPKPRKLSIRRELYPYEVVRHPRFYSTHFFVRWYRKFLLQQFHRQQFDVLHCHGIYPPSYLAALLGNELPVPVVVTSHGGDVYADNVRLQKPAILERCVTGLRRADALVAISRFTRDGYTRLCRNAAPRIVDIPNGVHLSAYAERATAVPAGFDKLTPGEYAIFLGRLKYRKGADVLLKALAKAAFITQVQLAIIGDGEERAFLKILCDQLGLNDQVHFFGSQSGAAKLYLLQNARFGVVPSRQWESFGLVVLEAYAAGLPVVATDLPGLADLIQPEKTGLLVPPESPDDLAAALVRMFDDDALVQRMGHASRHLVQQYDWCAIARRHLALYASLIRSQSKLAA
jgi:glycosyltransferase involved in cell wall biosynthesis